MLRPPRKVLVVLLFILVVSAGSALYYFIGNWRRAEYRAAREALDRRDFQAESSHLDRYLANHPDELDARLLAAQTARRRNAFDEFHGHIAIYKKQNGPERGRTREYQLLRMQRGDLSEAAFHLQAAAAAPSEPESALALEAVIEGALAAVDERSGQSSRRPAGSTDPNVVVARQAVELWLASRPGVPDQLQGLIWRGRVRAAAGEYALSLQDFREVLRREPRHFDAQYQLAITIGSANHTEAAELLEQLRKAQPENSMVLFALANSYRLLGRPADARGILQGLLQRGMKETWLLDELGLTEMDCGSPAEAERLFRQSLDQHPDDTVANLGMSRCMMLAGNVEEATRFQQRYEAARSKGKSTTAFGQQP
jgi:tetratricopeptide (TPR) repeat protein